MMRYDYYFTFKAIGIFMINCNYVLCRCKKKKPNKNDKKTEIVILI